jgi:hypothetical protein
MSLEITRADFTEAGHARFAERLQESLDALGLLRQGFGTGQATLGAELTLVDPAGRPLPVNRSVLAAAVDPRISLEIDRFNLDVNARPVLWRVAPSRRSGRSWRTRSVPSIGPRRHTAGDPSPSASCTIGILPTLKRDDLQPGMLTDSER